MKYRVVQESDNQSYLLDCPIQLVKSMVIFEEETAINSLFLKYFNTTKKPVKSISVKLKAREKGNRKAVESILVFSPDKPLFMMKNKTPQPFLAGEFGSVEIVCDKVVFSCGEVWEVSKKPVFSPMPRKISLTTVSKYKEQIDAFWAEYATPKYVYSENDQLWRCGCGSVNQHADCHRCGISRISAKNCFSVTRLSREYKWIQQQKEERAKKEEEKEAYNLSMAKVYDDVFEDTYKYQNSPSELELLRAKRRLTTLAKQENFEKRVQAGEILSRVDAQLAKVKERSREFLAIVKEESDKLISEAKERKKIQDRKRKIATVALSSLCAIVLVVVTSFSYITNIAIPSMKYSEATKAYLSGDYLTAAEIYSGLDGYKDSEDIAISSIYLYGISLLDSGEFLTARDVFDSLSGYENSESYIVQSYVDEAVYLKDTGSYKDAILVAETVENSDTADALVLECNYLLGVEAYNSGNSSEALIYFDLADGYSDADGITEVIMQNMASEFFASGDYGSVITLLEHTNYDFTDDYMSIVVPVYEQNALAFYDAGDYVTAKAMYEILADCGSWLSGTAAKRIVAYPVYCDARLYGDNFDDVISVFDLSYESFKIVEEVSGYMAQFLVDATWVEFTNNTLNTDRKMTLSSDGTASLVLAGIRATGEFDYINGYVYIDGSKIVEMHINSYSSITFTVAKDDYDEYARIAN